MKREDLTALGLEKEVIDKVLDLHHAEMDPVKGKAEKYDSEKERADGLKKDFDEQAVAIKKLKESNGDAEKLQAEIEKLNSAAENSAEEHKKALSDMQKKIDDTEFDKALDGVISQSGAKRLASVKAELDLQTLRESKNREKDMAEAVKALKDSDDTSFLFGTAEPNPTGNKANTAGGVGGGDDESAQIATARAVMGLPPIESKEK